MGSICLGGKKTECWAGTYEVDNGIHVNVCFTVIVIRVESSLLVRCQSCPKGFYSNGTNSTKCACCPVGYQSSHGKDGCQPCGYNEWSSGDPDNECGVCRTCSLSDNCKTSRISCY